ncbi:MAG: DUF4258 domain-containing protein [Candidatus Thermoplasmatota archaeon]|nr:DUF4258 domain-containing protein [Candidatus Thermoplasmatota archaeon]MCG2825162.1 DUF4258 domain-containing protein [Thermoplasmatales archaeon]
MIIYKDLKKLKEDVTDLIQDSQYIIQWQHIKPLHPEIEKIDILSTLLYGKYAIDKHTDWRYISWSQLTIRKKLIRVVFEMHKNHGRKVVVITAFEEE